MQQTFDWTRAEQLGTLDRSVLPCVNIREGKRSVGVTSAAMKSVLRAIDSFGRGRECWPSEHTLAEQSGLSVRTVKRAVRALVELSVLCCERRGQLTLNHYRIVWNELALLTSEHAKQLAERSAMVAERSAMVAERSAMVAERSAMVALETYKKRFETTNETGASDRHELVELVFSLGIQKAKAAIEGAERLGLSSAEIRERVAEWQRLEDAKRVPGVLFNWLGMRGSWERRNADPLAIVYAPKSRRGDSLSREEMARHSLRVRIKQEGLATGVGLDEIERRWLAAGV
jgi:AraC-like DNA-binding protein